MALFGAFALWSVVLFVVSRRRDRRTDTVHPGGTLAGDAIFAVVGLAAWIAFAFWLHLWLIGADPRPLD